MVEKDLALRHLPLASALAFALASGPAEAAPSAPSICRIEPFQLNFGLDVGTRMVVRSGTTCSISFVQTGPMRSQSAGGINHLGIAEQAGHGRAGTSGFTSWGYASQKGYTGPDRFVLEVGGETMSRRVISGTSRVTVDVDVVP